MKSNKFIYTFILGLSFMMFSCQSLVDDINDDPNSIPTEDIEQRLFLSGAQLSNISFNVGHLSRISGLYSGQLSGFQSVYNDVFNYNISTAESNSSWNKIYVGVLNNTNSMIRNAPTDPLLIGICKVLEANAVGTGAAVFGDVPYSEAASDIDDPVFDSQVSVLNAVQNTLDEAIASLSAGASRPLAEDIHFGGDADKWIATAYTLKARYYMLTRDYGNAYSAAQNGIKDDASSLVYQPLGLSAADDNNQFWTMLNGARGGDIGSGDSYLSQILDSSTAVYRGNSKTDETARSAYAYISEESGDANLGIIEQVEAQDLVSYAENALTLAEAGARTQNFNTGLDHLNDYRAWLNTGAFLNANFDTLDFTYAAYEEGDFMNGGMENTDNIDATRALLREISEERYVSGFLTWMPFNDHRRYRKSDPDLVVPFDVNNPSAPGHVQRLPYPSDELNANSNAPADDPGIFTNTEVNR